ncbi:MAG: transglutaminase domain-containing protein [Planctomycetes bacterium]|nr:transglutaminase domain-containing protein [Planctomycetota bacterium]
MKRFAIFLLAGLLSACSSGDVAEDATMAARPADPMPSRTFHVRYVAEASKLPVGRSLRLWIPIPSNDPWQTIRNLKVTSVEGDFDFRITREPVHGNRMIYVDQRVTSPQVTFEINYDVIRHERIENLANLRSDGMPEGEASIYLQPSKLAVVDADILMQEKELAGSETDTLKKARRFYDHVLQQMRYGKPEGLAWGRGDTKYACDARVGNCTDFHSWFISLCLAAKIPARFQIGLYGDYETKPGEEFKTGGYHCWAEFRVPGKAWVPVDISEADKDLSRQDYFFGGHTNNRVTLSTGRDLVLQPAQAGESLNYFLAPYAEVDGQVHESVSKTSYWTDAL